MEEGETTSAVHASRTRPEEISQVEITVLLPCLNEVATLGACISKAKSAIQENRIHAEVLVADNGSTDGSQEVARKLGARVVSVEAKGYGSALLGGIAGARGRFIIMADSDDSYDLTNLSPFVDKLREGYDLVVGNRFRGAISRGAMPWLHRYLGTPVLTALARIFFRTPCGDVNCGMRGFRKESIERLGLRSLGMEFASEMLVKSSLFGLRIAEVPRSLSRDGRTSRPHLRTWRDGWRHLRFMLLYSPRWLFLYPGAALMLLGLLLGAWLLPGPRFIAGIGFDVHTLIYAAVMVMIGFQAVHFAVFTKVFAIQEGLLPADEKFTRLFKIVNLEVGLTIGALLMFLGFAATFVAIGYWGRHNFGTLDPARTLRLVIPGIVCLTLGFQTILSSFFLSVLGMARR